MAGLDQVDIVDTQVQAEPLVIPGLLVIVEQAVHLVILELKEQVVLAVLEDKMEFLDIVDFLVYQDILEQQEIKELLDLVERADILDSQDLADLVDLLESLVILVPQECQDTQVFRAIQEFLVIQGLVAHLVSQE